MAPEAGDPGDDAESDADGGEFGLERELEGDEPDEEAGATRDRLLPGLLAPEASLANRSTRSIHWIRLTQIIFQFYYLKECDITVEYF